MSLSKKKVAMGLKRLQEAGITPERWLQMLDADPATMQRLAAAWPGAPVIASALKGTGIVYDATAIARILGLPCECSEPVPQAADGEIVVYYGGWDFDTLNLSPGGMKRMWDDQDLDPECQEWAAEPGYYRLLLPVPNSNRKTWNDQISHLAGIDTAWKPAPICVSNTALVAHLIETGNNLLRDDWCRCAEPLSGGRHAELAVSNGRVYAISCRDDQSHDRIWLSAARKS